jgi:DNA repair protein RadC
MNTIKIEKSPELAEIKISYKSKVKPSERKQILSSKDSYEILKNLFDEDTIEHHEEMILLCLNRANRLLGWVKISSGGITGTVCDPRVIFQIAISTNSTNIIIAHNHPGGNTKPSQEDINLTKRISHGGLILEIRLLDHIIISSESYFSFADEGMI